MSQPRRQLVIAGHQAREPEISRWLWCIEDGRARTMQRLDGLAPALIDWTPPEGGNSIGSILYHIAAIEIDYVYADLLEEAFPLEIIAMLPFDVREENGLLTQVSGFDLAWYRTRLEAGRRRLLELFEAMDMADYVRARERDWADITPEWTLHHLIQHEAEHRGEIAAIRARAAA
jgi:uncharacterized damage-inducible protein DinB